MAIVTSCTNIKQHHERNKMLKILYVLKRSPAYMEKELAKGEEPFMHPVAASTRGSTPQSGLFADLLAQACAARGPWPAQIFFL